MDYADLVRVICAASDAHISFSTSRLAWPSLPTMMWSCTAMPEGFASVQILVCARYSMRDT